MFVRVRLLALCLLVTLAVDKSILVDGMGVSVGGQGQERKWWVVGYHICGIDIRPSGGKFKHFYHG